jgi:phosphohistidine phosphatase
MDILIVRHAISMDRTEAMTLGMLDRDRPLTQRGRARMKRAARGIAALVPGVGTLITSPLRRAVQTAEILARPYKGLTAVQSDTLLPEADPAGLAELFAETPVEATALVVGHEPHLSGWISWCLCGEARSVLALKKGGACLLRFEAAPGPARGRLLWLSTPSVLRRL